MKKILIFLLLISAPCFAQNFPCSSRTPMIVDDDNAGDPDSMASFYMALKWNDLGCINLLGEMADTSNTYAAPAIETVHVYAKHGDIPVGANQANTPNGTNCVVDNCNSSTWTGPVVTRFNPGDVRTNYTSCDIEYRKLLANQATNSVVIVMTGYTPCVAQLLLTSADGYSPLTGVQLAQQKVKWLVIEAGFWSSNDPSGSESNAYNDSNGYNALLTTWTSQNGYPPIYFTDYYDGIYANSGPATWQSPLVNSVEYSLNLAQSSCAGADSGTCVTGFQRPTWGQISILFGAWGLSHNGTTYYTSTANGTATINASNGTSTFSTSTASGHYILTLQTGLTIELTNLFDCYSRTGTAAVGSFGPCLPPLGGLGTLTTTKISGSAAVH